MKYAVALTTVVEIDVSDAILALHKDPAWVRDFYDLDTPEKIVAHLAYNCGLHYRDVSRLDGFADQPNSDVTARVIATDTERVERLA